MVLKARNIQIFHVNFLLRDKSCSRIILVHYVDLVSNFTIQLSYTLQCVEYED